MKLVKAFFGWTRENDLDHVWPLIFYLLAYLVWFHIIEIVPRAHYVQVILAVDRFIPFNEWFVIPYLSWFLFITIGIVYVYLTDRTCFDELATSLMTGMTVWGLLIILSTVYIKQHSLFDVLTALALNLICWYAVDRRGRFFRFRRWDRWVEQRYRERDSEVGG